MYTDLSPHLHTSECNIIIRAYQKCQLDNPLRSYMGYCNPLYHDVVSCLKNERLVKRDANRPKHGWTDESQFKDFDTFQQKQNKS